MWVLKIAWKHDCIIGNRCERFQVMAIGVPLDAYKERGRYSYMHFQKIMGEKERIKEFIADLKKDPKISNLEVQGDVVFFLYSLPEIDKVPTTHYNRRVFFLKPVIVDTEGYEHWEIASWKKENLMEFIRETKKLKDLQGLKIKKIIKSKLNEIYFPQVMPALSKEQKKAIELATKEGYYDFPRKIELLDLAKLSKKSLSTYREHLRKAEKRLIPDLIKNLSS